MRYLTVLLLFLVGCASYPRKQVGMVHDYIFRLSEDVCRHHDSELHYIVSIKTLEGEGDHGEYPCTDIYKVRCQDGSLHNVESGIKSCFISEMQLKETLK